jgi:hypothetical protein
MGNKLRLFSTKVTSISLKKSSPQFENNGKSDRKEKRDEIKNLLKEVLYNSLAQAIIKIILTPHLILKLILFLFVVGTSGIVSYLVIKSILTFFTYGVTTTSRTIFETPTLFPKVTFCNTNHFTTKYAFELDQKYINDHFMLSDEEKKKLGHDLSLILSECSYNDEPCDSTDFVWSFSAWYGNCYTFNSGKNSIGEKITVKNSTIAGPYFGLQLKLYVNFYEEIDNNNLGALIRIGKSSYSTFYFDGGILVSSGTRTNIAVNREFKSMLPKPYSNCLIDSNSPRFIQDLDLYNLIIQSEYEYTQQLCFVQCYQRFVINKYNCSYPFYVSLFNVTKCDTNLTNSLIDNFDFLTSDLLETKCISLCPLECNQNLYMTSISSCQLNENKYFLDFIQSNNSNLTSDFINRTLNLKTAKDSFVQVNIFYDSLSYTLTTESPQMDVISLLGSIGGNLGLFLGVSVFSLCELIEVSIQIYFILKQREKSQF